MTDHPPITVGVLAGEARCRMERLVNVAN